MADATHAPQSPRTFRAGFVLNIVGVADEVATLCIDCTRCGNTICEVEPDTLCNDPRWLTNQLLAHELRHNGVPATVEVKV